MQTADKYVRESVSMPMTLGCIFMQQ